MLRFVLVVLFAISPLSLFVRASQQTEAAPKGIEGIWHGKLKVGAIELRLVFQLSKKDQGYNAKMDSPDQGASGIPCDEVVFKDGQVRIEIKKLKGKYQGKLKNANEIAGDWQQGGQTFPLTLKRTDKAPSVQRPQEPKRPYPYRDEEITYANEKAGIKFAGTLTLPRGKGPFPAVLLITGSGPQDRNESVLGHKPFLVLADYLTRRGIAVLRVDDRGVGGSGGDTMSSTSADFAGDALAGVAFLKTRAEIDPRHIGLVGHSEGGIVAPLAAVRSPDVAFIVLLAGTGLVGEELMYLQGALVTKSMGGSAKDVASNRRVQQAIFKIVKEEKDNVKAAKKIDDLETELLAKIDDAKERKKLAGSLGAQKTLVLSAWFRSFLAYDPAPALRKVKCPVLALVGAKDVQVAPKENLAAISRALKEGDNQDYTVKELPGLNHLFQRCKTGAVSEYSQIEETIAPAALEEIADWILKRTAK